MHAHDKVKNVLDRLEKLLFVVNVNIEFTLDSIVDKNASLDVKFVIFIVPVSLESNWYSLPSVRVRLSKSVAAKSDNALSKHMGLLVEVHVMLARIVEATYGKRVPVNRSKSLSL